MYEYLHDYVTPKYGKKSKLSYMDRDSFVVNIKPYHIFKDIPEFLEARFGT